MAGWSNPKNFCTRRINNTPSIIFGSQQTSFIDSIAITNTVANNIFVTINLLQENESLIAVEYCRRNKVLIPSFDTLILLKGDLQNSMPGDLWLAHTDSSFNFCDSILSYRELTQPTS
jgi:hypothetical protein